MASPAPRCIGAGRLPKPPAQAGRHEMLLAFSCKGRYFCPSPMNRDLSTCHQWHIPLAGKRVLQFAEWVTQAVLEPVPHSQSVDPESSGYVFTIPKMLRVYFKHDRKLLGALSHCAWKTLLQYFQAAWPDSAVRPGAILSIQTYGRACNYHPHLHLLVTDGCFDRQGAFYPLPFVDTPPLVEHPGNGESLFRHKVLHLLLEQDKISPARVELLLSCRQIPSHRGKHSGFSIHRGRAVDPETSGQVGPEDVQGRETLTAYLLHAPISEQRLDYEPASATVNYDPPAQPPAWPYAVHEPGIQTQQTFTALDWLVEHPGHGAALTSHIPNKGEQRVRYYGHYSPENCVGIFDNKSRGQRQLEDPALFAGKAGSSGSSTAPQVNPAATETADAELQEFRSVDPDLSGKACRRNWARLIKSLDPDSSGKVYEVDPLVCAKCGTPMEIVSFIEDPQVIKTILVHLQLWQVPPRPPPVTVSAPQTIGDYGFFDHLAS